uniref:4-oxalocrotonate tautomerase n=1 Tax=Escherichia coli TaxID=562 RepID=I3VZX9_ECOLX|nr:4-oxalocrotonate tautomerase [Escherichia coli]AFK88906.1 4-oxalocrotonate tautomerase [Escherichia coli]
MPHLDLHFNPRELSEEDIAKMADELCKVLKSYLATSESAISIAMTRVWKEQVYDPIIAPQLGALFKKPGYTL